MNQLFDELALCALCYLPCGTNLQPKPITNKSARKEYSAHSGSQPFHLGTRQ